MLVTNLYYFYEKVARSYKASNICSKSFDDAICFTENLFKELFESESAAGLNFKAS